ncbi:RHS repeat domain-containing protein [Pseudomonas sp. nanlin1]|uniref:RHS repeat domain-containing protein n=1 Tax=Pseudomonas sp. nanlin1 TaxID=3040605 RepID=UPI0038910853
MPSYSREELLTLMAGKPMTFGWGALMVYSRTRLNELLLEQHLDSLQQFNYLPPFNVELELPETPELYILKDAVLGAPHISFETASLHNSTVRVTLPLLSGEYSLAYKHIGPGRDVRQATFITEGMGHSFSMDIDLRGVLGEFDNHGNLSLNLRGAKQFECSLVQGELSQLEMGKAFARFLDAQPSARCEYLLSAVDYAGNNPIRPARFIVRTQAAPGAKQRNAENFGEGAVVLFISTAADEFDGSLPADESQFPFLIPNDRDSEGQPEFTASLVLNHKHRGHAQGDRLDLISSFLFPSEFAFTATSQHEPHDLVAFGNIAPGVHYTRVEPAFSRVRPNGQQPFRLFDSEGAPLAATWQVVSLNNRNSAGTVNGNGRYTASSGANFDHPDVLNLVQASYVDPETGHTRTRSARVAVSLRPLALSPNVSVLKLGEIAPEPLVITATTQSAASELTWTLLGAGLGTLTASGYSATYTAPADLPADQRLAVDVVQVRDRSTGDRTLAVIGLPTGQFDIILDHDDQALLADQQLHIIPDVVDDSVTYLWTVYGEGSIAPSSDGVGAIYTAPATITHPASLVLCEGVWQGSVFFVGYTTVMLTDFVPEPRWEQLASFKLKPAITPTAFANGYQQIPVDIEIVTAAVDGKLIPITNQELASLVLVNRATQQELPFLPAFEAGMADTEANRHGWAVSTQRNQYDMRQSQASQALAFEGNAALPLADDARAVRTLFVHTLADLPLEIVAKFRDDLGKFHSSLTIDGNHNPDGILELQPVRTPTFTSEDYELKRKRVAGGGVGTGPGGEDDFDYHLTTTDYWRLSLKGPVGAARRFVQVSFEDNESTVQWESKQLAEEMFSYTGYAFIPAKSNATVKTLTFDRIAPGLLGDKLDKQIVPSERVVAGELLVALMRRMDVKYSHRHPLAKPQQIFLRDLDGNPHRLHLAFLPEDRNQLELMSLGRAGPGAAKTAVHSKAFDFMSFLTTGVDPRTGQYPLSINVPELKGNDLSGPDLALKLDFNPLRTEDSGFGHGWGINLSQYTPRDQILALSTGETFKVTGSGFQPEIAEKKLDSFHFYNLGFDPLNPEPGKYKVVHKSGLVEVLQLQGTGAAQTALPVEHRSEQGRRLSFSYGTYASWPLLKEVRDEQRLLLRITRSDYEVLLQMWPDDADAVLYRMTLTSSDRRVGRIELPSADKAAWQLAYESFPGLPGYLFLSRVQTPTGAVETITHRSELSYPSTPGTPSRVPLRRVDSHSVEPGSGQPPSVTRYRYDPDGGNYNFLGYGAQNLVYQEDGLDNLYRANERYVYGSVESQVVDGQVVRTITRRFNRFHLLTEEITQQGSHVSSTLTDYYADDTLPFSRQLPQFQLPRISTQRWHLEGQSEQFSQIERTTYSDTGNLTSRTEPNGVITQYEWYPASAALPDWPGDPQGFERHERSQRVVPAASAHAAPTLLTAYRYSLLSPLEGTSAAFLVRTQETLLQVSGAEQTLVEETQLDYFDTPQDSLLHGRQKQRKVTLNGLGRITEFSYRKDFSRRVGETVLHTQEVHSSDFDAASRTIDLEHSLLHGEPLLTVESPEQEGTAAQDSGAMVRYQYDELVRVTQETVGPGTEYEASRRYAYYLSSDPGRQSEQHTTDVKGVVTVSYFDGLNRVVRETRVDVDNPGRHGEARSIYAAQYDALGQLRSETEYDWLGEQDLALTTTLEYDDWGEPCLTQGPDQVKRYSVKDPIALTTTEWLPGQGVTVTHHNLFEKPLKVERLAPDGQTQAALRTCEYDGLGRTRVENDQVDGGEERIKEFRYDLFDRLIENTLADGSVVHRDFARHSREDLPTRIAVEGYFRDSRKRTMRQQALLGEQTFDSLERMTSATTGGRRRLFRFKGGERQPFEVVTPAGTNIAYTYNPQLGAEPTARGTAAHRAAYTYDPLNAQLLKSEEAGDDGQPETVLREYASNGELRSETRGEGAERRQMFYQYSLRGRLLSYTDVLGQAQTYHYDDAGRLQRTQLQGTTTLFGYDAQGLVSSIASSEGDRALQLTVSLEYDPFGREISRTFASREGFNQRLEQAYNSVDQVTQRTLSDLDKGTVLRDEHYAYDERGRLADYRCSGAQAPVDAIGKPILRQVFGFDSIDNIITVLTDTPDGRNIETYSYDAVEDPTQLTALRNSHAAYPPAVQFTYDDDGNMLQDEKGNDLLYDEYGRLINVGDPAASPTLYRYDAQDVLSQSTLAGKTERRYYCNDVLVNLVGPDENTRIMRGGEHLLAEIKSDGAADGLLTDAQQSVLGKPEAGRAVR